MTAKAIETIWAGYRFRSRTEARWAVFFDNMGLKWEYEREGFSLPSGSYLPDFYLPELETWFEVKSEEPNERELASCAELAKETKKPVIISCTAPTGIADVYYIDSIGEKRAPKFHFLEDRRTSGEFWLASYDEWFSIGPIKGEDHGRHPVRSERVQSSYSAARQARFEHGEKPKIGGKWW